MRRGGRVSGDVPGAGAQSKGGQGRRLAGAVALRRQPPRRCTGAGHLYAPKGRETGGVETMAGPAPDPCRAERLAILDEEIGRLPERQRAAVMLCDLEGLAHEEAARRLGCPVGTVESRLSRGRQRLRGRLVRRGLAPAAAALWAEMAREASATMPAALIKQTAQFMTSSAAAGAVPVAVTTIAEGVIQMMWLARLKPLAAVAAALILATAGVAVHGRQQPAPERKRGTGQDGSSRDSRRGRAPPCRTWRPTGPLPGSSSP